MKIIIGIIIICAIVELFKTIHNYFASLKGKKTYRNSVIYSECNGRIGKENLKELILYYENGSMKEQIVINSIDRTLFLNIKRYNGNLNCYFENCQTFINSGVFVYPNGNCVLSGVLKCYYPNGNLRFIVNYLDGKRLGTLESFYETGDTEMIINYSEGEPVDGILYTLQGDVKQLNVAHLNNMKRDNYLLKDIKFSWVKELL